MTWHSPMGIAIRWRTVKQRKRGCLMFWICDFIYLVSGFHL